MIEMLLLFLGVVVGYNIRHERVVHEENLVLEKVDARLRRDLVVACNLNDSLKQDIAELKAQLSAMKSASSYENASR